jgi:hypothetical protein
MRILVRIGLAVLTSIQLITGVWMQFFPRGFYSDFPTVDLTPPFSEHLMRDFGGATLGLAVVVAAAAVWMERRLVIVALVAYLVYSVPHLAFHLGHLHHASSLDVAFIVLTLGGSVLLPIAVLTLAVRMGPLPAE